MTHQRSNKRAVRARMTQTGEKYTQARRAMVRRGRDGGATAVTQVAGPRAQPLAWFTDQGYNVIVLAQDEARMLGQPQVAPEHVLLARPVRAGRRSCSRAQGSAAGAIHGALVPGARFARLVRAPSPTRPSVPGGAVGGRSGAPERAASTAPAASTCYSGWTTRAPAPSPCWRDLGIADAAALVDARGIPATRAAPDQPCPATPAARFAPAAESPDHGHRVRTLHRSACEAIVLSDAQRVRADALRLPERAAGTPAGRRARHGRRRSRHEQVAGAAVALARELLAAPRDRRSPSTQPPAQWPPLFAGADHLVPAGGMLLRAARPGRAAALPHSPTSPGAWSPRTCSRSRGASATAGCATATCFSPSSRAPTTTCARSSRGDRDRADRRAGRARACRRPGRLSTITRPQYSPATPQPSTIAGPTPIRSGVTNPSISPASTSHGAVPSTRPTDERAVCTRAVARGRGPGSISDHPTRARRPPSPRCTTAPARRAARAARSPCRAAR